jgi:hypothetical protein
VREQADPLQPLGLALLKRGNCTEQDLDAAKFLARRSGREILRPASEKPLAPVEIARAEQQGSRQKQHKQRAGSRQQKSRPPE